MRTYSELIKIKNFKDRFEYLKLNAEIGTETFGFDRYLNQEFYKSKEWRSIRNKVILRDNGCDLGINGFEIHGQIIVHHLNPIMLKDLQNEQSELILNPEYLICTSLDTHNCIHYGGEPLALHCEPVVRRSGDTKLW